MELLHKEVTDTIIKAFYEVYNELGYGFLEKVYEKALCIALDSHLLDVKTQEPIKVFFRGQTAGLFYSDILVENKVIIEIKAGSLKEEHEYQLLNYLKATDIEVGLLMSFGKTPVFKRKVFSNKHKNR
ncbi:MAG: GxxExxY protein [Saprospiraceae bacterium]